MPNAAPSICMRCKKRSNDCKCPPRQPFANKRNKPALNKLYSSGRWQRVRKQRLRMDRYLCQYHKQRDEVAPATEVDHVTPAVDLIAAGNVEPFFNVDNLRSTCRDCHKAKTAREGSRGKF